MTKPKDHPEWSEEGRDARFGPGWWIVPLLALTALVALFWLM